MPQCQKWLETFFPQAIALRAGARRLNRVITRQVVRAWQMMTLLGIVSAHVWAMLLSSFTGHFLKLHGDSARKCRIRWLKDLRIHGLPGKHAIHEATWGYSQELSMRRLKDLQIHGLSGKHAIHEATWGFSQELWNESVEGLTNLWITWK